MHGHSFLDMLINAVARSAVYRAVGAMTRGHGVMVTVAICVALVGCAWLAKRYTAKS